MEVNEQVEKILAYGECCDHCLGRFFGKRSHGLTNDERGRGSGLHGLLPPTSHTRVSRAPAGSVATSLTQCPNGQKK